MAPVPRRSTDPRAVRTRVAILDAARSEFEERGLEATTIAMIAARAHVGISSIYVHYPSKSALIDALVGEALDRHSGAFLAARAETEGLTRALRLCEACVRFAAAEPVAAQALSTAGQSTEPDAAPRAREFLDALVDDLEVQARQLASDGVLPPAAVPGAVALLTALTLGLLEQTIRRDALGVPVETAISAVGVAERWLSGVHHAKVA